MRTGSIQAFDGSTPAGDAEGAPPPAARSALQPPLAVLLREGYRWFMEQLNDDATAVGEPRLSAAAAVVVSYVQPQGSRAAEVARAMGVTRQHVHAVVRELTDAGVVDTVPDPASRRDRLIIPTVDGETRRRRAVARLAALEADIGQRIGPADLDRLRDILTHLWNPRPDRPLPVDLP